MGAALDRREAQGGRLTLDGVRLPEKSIEFLAEQAFFPGRLAKHRIDHLHGRVRIVQERRQLRRIDVQNAEQRVHLTLGLALRGLKFTGEFDSRADVRDGYEYLGDLALDPHSMKFELQIARFEPAPAYVEMNLDLSQGIDRLDQLFIGPLRPENRDEFQGGSQCFFGYDILEQTFECKAGEIGALEQSFQCSRVGGSDVEVL